MRPLEVELLFLVLLLLYIDYVVDVINHHCRNLFGETTVFVYSTNSNLEMVYIWNNNDSGWFLE